MSAESSVLIALGGNALILPGERGYIEEQFHHTDACMRPIAALISQGTQVVITHGNGPIVGNILLRNECGYIPPMPLYICVADSQGGIGAMMAESLGNELRRLGVDKTISVIITHILVARDDPAFEEPSKPIGPYYSEGDAAKYINEGWKMREIPGRGWRRVVPSPKPQEIVEMQGIRTAFENGIIPIVVGGGGIPVVKEEGLLKGIDAVIDKDLAASLLACELRVERFVILTDVDGVYLHWETEKRRRLESLIVKDAERYLTQGQFPPGSMGPKVAAAIQFLQLGGKDAVIAKSEDLIQAMQGSAGTRISM
ncbi:MAG TPA: carbamate kinase [Nitrospiraceae bacterium]|jgi:carbamate kinase|nr:carbamate kinase [Nitrospiraceae bacterium]